MTEELQGLIEALAQERTRAADEDGESLEIHLDFDDDAAVIARAVPAPPATAAEVAAAEEALGRPYPPEYRDLLAVANGFPDFLFGDVLLGTAGVGTEGEPGVPAAYPGSVWGLARAYIDEWYASEGGPLEHSPTNPAECIPLVSDDNGSGAAYVVATSGPSWTQGSVVALVSGGIDVFPSIREYLRSRIEEAQQ